MRVVATAGHVDHGKSSLLRALTGMEPDRWDEERRRGLTIDLGFVWTDLEIGGHTVTVAFVDVPGHERFVPNMLAGAGAVRLALFVVAADDGWSEQSQEHLDILDLLEVDGAVAAVTKLRLAGEDRAVEVAADVEERLTATTLQGAPVHLVDSLTGDGLDELRASLASRLDAAPLPRDEDRPRLWVDRTFSISGAGTIVTGTLTGGVLAVGDEVTLLPDGGTTRIRGMQSLGEPVDRAESDSRVALNLAGVAREDLGRGHVVVAGPANRWVVSTSFDGWVRVLPGQQVGRKGAWHVHTGSAEVTATVHPLLGEDLSGGSEGYLRLDLDRPVVIAAGDRFVLREAGRRATCGGGEVLDALPDGRIRGTDARLERVSELEAVRDAPRDARLRPLLLAHGGAWSRGVALAAAGLDEPPPDVATVGSHLIEPGHLAAWAGAVAAAASRHHETEPASPGAGRSALTTAATAAGCPPEAADELVDHLTRSGDLRRSGSAYALASFAPRRDEARERRRDELLRRLGEEPFGPPDLEVTAREIGMSHEELTGVVHDGLVVRCGPVAFTRTAVDEAATLLRSLAATQGPFTASEAREALGTSRKYAIPLLEHLDAAGVTAFDGALRTVR